MRASSATLILVFLSSVLTAQENAAEQEIKKLQGTWLRTSFSADGKTEQDGDRPAEKQVKLVIKDKLFHDTPFTLDVTKNPRHIDLKETDAKGKESTLPGIYELKGDVLKICLPFPFEGKTDQLHKRPTSFITKAGENHVVEVYRRVKK